MDQGRRQLLLKGLLGTGWLGLRALASGLPAGLLAAPLSARAAEGECHATAPQKLILVTSAGGDPLNANVPGCYLDAGVYHPADAAMAATALTEGAVGAVAAKPWADLATTSPGLLARTCFLHHATYSNAHGDAAKVNALMGAVKRQELLVSLIAKHVAPCLSTTQNQPVVLSQNLVTYGGAVLPVLGPSSLRNVLGAPTGVLASLRDLRDADVDRLNALYRQDGNAAQRALLDELALSQRQARALSTDLLADLATINGTTRADLNTAAAILLKMNVSPVVVMSYSFGGDNHGDGALAGESRETVASVAALADLASKLARYGIQDQTTVVLQNVFGRTLNAANRGGNRDGRDHNAAHHCTVLLGKNVRPGVIGGITATANGLDFRATGIDSVTGAASATGDIPYEATLGAVGKTIAAAVGVDRAVIDDQITAGKVIGPALVG